MKKGIKIIIIIFLAIVIVFLSYYKKQKDENTIIVETPIEKKSIKIEEDKDFIYDLKTDNDYIVDGVQIPYINIYSNDAKKAREEIKYNLDNEELLYSKYTYYSSKVISLLIDYATNDKVRCLTYVFNDDGKLLSIKETANILDIKEYKDKINDRIFEILNNEENLIYVDENNLDIDSIYRNNINKDYIGYYVNEKGLNVIVDIVIDNTNVIREIITIS